MASDLPGLPRGWDLEVTYKPIRNIWFRADARCRRFRISAPAGIPVASLDKAIRAKAGWMAAKAAEPIVSPLIPHHIDTGSHCRVGGAFFPVRLESHSMENRVDFNHPLGVAIHARNGNDPARVLAEGYRKRLQEQMPDILSAWEPVLGVRTCQCRIRRMKTRWGSCNVRAKRIWINLALACLSHDLLEYVTVHELLHLLEPSHNQRFYRLMQGAMPDWKNRKDRLQGYAPGLG